MAAAASPLLDRSAALLSGLCVVHCVLAAVLVAAAAPIAWLGAHEVHLWGLALVVPPSLVALLRGWRSHADSRPGAIAIAGVALMAAGQGVGHGHAAEFVLTGLGAALHALGHGLNLRALSRLTA